MKKELFPRLPKLNPKGEPWKMVYPTKESISKFFKELRESEWFKEEKRKYEKGS